MHVESVTEGRVPRRILLADDDRFICDAIHSVLSSEWPDSEITVVADGLKARSLLGDAPQAFDLLITDLVMPGEDGFAVISFSRESCPRTRIVAMTGEFGSVMNQTFALAEAVCAGAHAILFKPFSADELMEAIRLAM